MGFLDKIKTSLTRGDSYDDQDIGADSLYDDYDDSYESDAYGSSDFADSNRDRGYSTHGYGRPGRGGLSDADGLDYDDPRRTRYDAYGRQGSRRDDYDEPSRDDRYDEPASDDDASEQDEGGITYRRSSSADSVHVLSRDDAEYGSRNASKGAEPTPTGEMRIVRATRYEDIEVVSRYFCAGDTVALVLAGVKPDVGRRILDFSFGVVSALSGKVDHVFGSVFVLTHGTHGITDQDRATLREQGLIE